jgi:transcriptional regulator with XRE-family HTH domain
MLDLSYYLKQFMIEKGLNKKQLAEKMGVSPAYITKIFSGQNISLKTVAKILSALEVDAGIKIIDREKINYKTAPNKDLFKLIKKGEENESKIFSTAA